jgi:hypothetical protein
MILRWQRRGNVGHRQGLKQAKGSEQSEPFFISGLLFHDLETQNP